MLECKYSSLLLFNCKSFDKHIEQREDRVTEWDPPSKVNFRSNSTKLSVHLFSSLFNPPLLIFAFLYLHACINNLKSIYETLYVPIQRYAYHFEMGTCRLSKQRHFLNEYLIKVLSFFFFYSFYISSVLQYKYKFKYV